MEKSIIKVGGMSCEHCVKAVTGAVEALPGIVSVAVDLDGGTATVEHDPAVCPAVKIKAAIEEEGFEASVRNC